MDDNYTFWDDKWLPYNTTHHAITPRGGLSEKARVMGHIDWDTKGWKTSLVRELFGAVITDVICQIPIGSIHYRDRQIWSGTSD
jgi:hypothetical protein